jgi:ubiquinone/menaquinone biosynthesis C-methylase UbiE
MKPGSTLVDIGSGSGAYVYEACRVLGAASKVIAIDIDQDRLKMVRDTAQVGGFVVDTLVADLEKKILLANYSADYIILANTLHMIEDRDGLMSECARILAPRGEMLVVEWNKESSFGPDKKLMIEENELQALAHKYGFTSMRGLVAGDYHYAYLFKNK